MTRRLSSSLICVIGFAAAVAAQQPSTSRPGITFRAGVSVTMTLPDSVLGRAVGYVAGYESSLGNVIADERYMQEVKPYSSTYYIGRRTVPVMKRYVLAQFLMVRVPATGEWIGFRDVTRVDDHDRPGRAAERDAVRRPLQEILDAGPLAEDQLRRLSREAARYNIGDVVRTVNIPTFALLVLRPSSQSRFRFTPKGRQRVGGIDAEVLAFEEIADTTIVRNTRGANLPLSGTLWIEPLKGTVVQTELETHDPEQDVRARIEVRYRPDDHLGMWVPIEMSERYFLGPKAGALEQRVSCLARYSNFRRARVDVRIR